MYYVYIMVSRAIEGAFYTGVTSDLIRRVYEHKHALIEGFTKKYGIKMLGYYEIHQEIEHAILREKAIKRWTRVKKIKAIEAINPQWNDLYETL